MKFQTFFPGLLLLVSTIWGLSPVVQALPSTTVGYQGYLTDAGSGAPADGTLELTFSLYTDAEGINRLWSETQTTRVQRGLFSVELGGVTPFPAGIFNDQLYLGIQVAGDTAELTPRQLLTSVPSAFQSDDAAALGGLSATTIDAHLQSRANPHAVTALQTGAATPQDIDNHRADTAAHHRKTDTFAELQGQADESQIPATIARATDVTVQVSLHAVDPAAHHAPYTDTQAVAAVLAADGQGSTLDADLLDGLQAAQIVAQAKDEVRIPIRSLPFAITQPGSYYLTADLSVADPATHGIMVNADHVTIDLHGYSISGPGLGTGVGIYILDRQNVTIRNGTVRNFGYDGISESAGRGHRVTDVTVTGNGGSGILLLGEGHHVSMNSVSYNSSDGVIAGPGSVVRDNLVFGNGGLGAISAGSGSLVQHNTAYQNQGDGIWVSESAIVSDNVANLNTGTGIVVNRNVVVRQNNASANSLRGIEAVGSGNVIEDNAAANSEFGIYFGAPGNFYSNNRASGNTLSDFAGAVPSGAADGGGNVSF